MSRRNFEFSDEEEERIKKLKRLYEWKTVIQTVRESLKIAEKTAPMEKRVSGVPPQSMRRG